MRAVYFFLNKFSTKKNFVLFGGMCSKKPWTRKKKVFAVFVYSTRLF